MRLNDARRLMGPNFLSRDPLVVVELEYDPGDKSDSVVSAYRSELYRMRAALSLSAISDLILFPHKSGLICAFPDSIDVLLAMAEVAEWAGQSAAELLAGRPAFSLEPKRTEIEAMLVAQRRPRVLALQAEAMRRHRPFLWDDEEISVGAGIGTQRWSWADAPDVKDVHWSELGTIPIALITGTNGKTTCSRLLARVAREAGFVVGSTSTQGVVIDGRTVATGDQTGPSAARSVLRNPSVQFAVLETARGGIMRRGLAVDSASAALITNVGADHLGHFGIDDVHAMARVKAVVGSVAKRLVLNAMDPELVEIAQSATAPVTFFSQDPDAPALRGGNEAWSVRDGWIVQSARGIETRLLPVSDVPITFGGAAVYNVENVLAVAAMSSALGLPTDALKRALIGFTAADNPGRGQFVDVNGVKVFLDFGHNGDGVRAVMRLVSSLHSAGRLAVITGAAGDRSDFETEAVVQAIVEARPDLVVVREMEKYLRGRQLGEVPELMRLHFIRLGTQPEAIRVTADEVTALALALDWAKPGDFIALLVHTDEEGARELLAARQKSSSSPGSSSSSSSSSASSSSSSSPSATRLAPVS